MVPSCKVRDFTEPGEFAASLRGSNVALTVLEPGGFSARITDITLGSLKIKRVSESLARIMHWTSNGDRATFMFPTGPSRRVVHDGIELNPNAIVHAGKQTSHFQRSFGPVSWGSISLPMEDVVSLGRVSTGVELTPPANDRISVSRPTVVARIQHLHAALGLIARDSPEIIENPSAARGLEQAMSQALADCLGDHCCLEQKSRRKHHQEIMRRYHAVLEANIDQPIYVLEMAKAIGASVRSLTACCNEYLGMGPKKYLMLRRMHLARQALLKTSPSSATVTGVAAIYGFWEFGRFAVQYKSLFGESPSVTLRKSRVLSASCN